MDRRIFLTGLAGVLVAAGCQRETGASQPASGGVCDTAVAERLTGRDRIPDAEAMEITGATIVRQIKPGDPVTMDYRQERITIETDPETGKIVRAYCG